MLMIMYCNCVLSVFRQSLTKWQLPIDSEQWEAVREKGGRESAKKCGTRDTLCRVEESAIPFLGLPIAMSERNKFDTQTHRTVQKKSIFSNIRSILFCHKHFYCKCQCHQHFSTCIQSSHSMPKRIRTFRQLVRTRFLSLSHSLPLCLSFQIVGVGGFVLLGRVRIAICTNEIFGIHSFSPCVVPDANDGKYADDKQIQIVPAKRRRQPEFESFVCHYLMSANFRNCEQFSSGFFFSMHHASNGIAVKLWIGCFFITFGM